MAKLFAEIENEEGKRVSLGSNDRISCTVYEGNKKQYSVYIEWGDIGDVIDNDGNDLPESEKRKGSTVTVKEWRNEPDTRRARTPQNIARWLKNGEHDKLREEDYIK
jgi:hypothetical protein